MAAFRGIALASCRRNPTATNQGTAWSVVGASIRRCGGGGQQSAAFCASSLQDRRFFRTTSTACLLSGDELSPLSPAPVVAPRACTIGSSAANPFAPVFSPVIPAAALGAPAWHAGAPMAARHIQLHSNLLATSSAACFSSSSSSSSSNSSRSGSSSGSISGSSNSNDKNDSGSNGTGGSPNALVAALPGIALAAGVAKVGFLGAGVLGQALLEFQQVDPAAGAASPISGIPVAILAGMLLRNSFGMHPALESGLKACTTTALRLGIVCVGAKLSAIDVMASGAASLPAALICVGTGLTVVPMLGRMMGLSTRLSYLIAGGTSICGVTAITALSPALGCSAREQSVAIATVVAFGTTAMLTYPYLAHYLFEHSQQIGMFLGLAIHDTSQVIGSALTYSAVYSDELVLKVAAITKLSRNLLLAAVVPSLSYMMAKQDRAAAAAASNAAGDSATSPGAIPKLSIADYVPTFVYGFLGMAAFRSVGDYTVTTHGAAFGLVDNEVWRSTMGFIASDVGGQYLLGTALAAVGLSTSFATLRGVGYAPFLVGLLGSAAIGSMGCALALSLPYLGLI